MGGEGKNHSSNTDDGRAQIFVSVKAAKFDFPSPEWNSISDKAKDFISSLLKKDPKARLTAANSLEHPWFADLGLVDKATLPNLTHGSEMNSKFAHFMGMAKLKKVRGRFPVYIL